VSGNSRVVANSETIPAGNSFSFDNWTKDLTLAMQFATVRYDSCQPPAPEKLHRYFFKNK
jgi:phosphatidylethanolamine-binding protein (PEBP) family uncharacterized protein